MFQLRAGPGPLKYSMLKSTLWIVEALPKVKLSIDELLNAVFAGSKTWERTELVPTVAPVIWSQRTEADAVDAPAASMTADNERCPMRMVSSPYEVLVVSLMA